MPICCNIIFGTVVRQRQVRVPTTAFEVFVRTATCCFCSRAIHIITFISITCGPTNANESVNYVNMEARTIGQNNPTTYWIHPVYPTIPVQLDSQQPTCDAPV